MTACCSAERFPQLRYGKGTVRLDLSTAASVNYLYGSEMPTIPDLGEPSAAPWRRAAPESR